MEPLISNDLKSKEKDKKSNRKLDTYFCLNVMQDEFDKFHNFFSVHIADTEEILETAIHGRNAVIHRFLPLLLLERGRFLWSWISACQLINQTESADQLGRMYNQMYAGIDALRGQTENNYSIPEFVKTIYNPTNMSIRDFELSLIIQVNMFATDSESFGPALRKFLVN